MLAGACGGSESAQPDPAATPTPFATADVIATPTPAPEPTATPVPEPTATPEPQPTATPEPAATPEPTALPQSDEPEPTATPAADEPAEPAQSDFERVAFAFYDITTRLLRNSDDVDQAELAELEHPDGDARPDFAGVLEFMRSEEIYLHTDVRYEVIPDSFRAELPDASPDLDSETRAVDLCVEFGEFRYVEGGGVFQTNDPGPFVVTVFMTVESPPAVWSFVNSDVPDQCEITS